MTEVDIQDILLKIKEYDTTTYLHSVRVSYYATQLAKEMGLDDERIKLIREASLIHDIGKIKIPASIIKGTEKLTPETRKIINNHTRRGFQFLLDRYTSIPKVYLRAVLLHHERADGSGYPFGLTSSEIGIETEIISVADVYDALISERPYKKGILRDEALNYFYNESKESFNQEVINALSNCDFSSTEKVS